MDNFIKDFQSRQKLIKYLKGFYNIWSLSDKNNSSVKFSGSRTTTLVLKLSICLLLNAWTHSRERLDYVVSTEVAKTWPYCCQISEVFFRQDENFVNRAERNVPVTLDDVNLDILCFVRVAWPLDSLSIKTTLTHVLKFFFFLFGVLNSFILRVRLL